MPRFAANLSFLFTELPFLERFAAARQAGFNGVEFLFPYEQPAEALAERLAETGLEQVLFNLPPGDWQAGERGLAALPGREVEFEAGVETALAYAQTLGCRRLHVLAGIPPGDLAPELALATYRANLARAAATAAPHGITLLIEPINGRDMPGYLLQTTALAERVIDEVAAANLRLQLDLYHCQIMEGDLSRRIARLLPLIGHMQIAGVPERHEPDEGEVNYHALFRLLDQLGYGGWVGCEYRPRTETRAGLGWLEALTV